MLWNPSLSTSHQPRTLSFLSCRPRNHYNELVGFGLDNVETVIENGVSLAGAGQEPMVLGR